MGADSGAENVHGQQRIVAVADETARCAQGVTPYDIARASDANAAAAREALHVRRRIVEQAAQRFGAASDTEGV